MKQVAFSGWENCVQLRSGDVELILTRDVGPRIVRFGFVGEANLFAEIEGQQGGKGEAEWMLRGGHRFWIAPEVQPDTYELDNTAIETEAIPGGIRTIQPPGSITAVAKTMEICLDDASGEVSVRHTLLNTGTVSRELAPWALTVMAPNGTAIIPLPKKIPHTERLTHNQEWSIWGYTDFSDPRWTLGTRYILFRQDPERGPNKLGIAHREGWVGYSLGEFLFVKEFERLEGEIYPDGGVNFETFSNEDFLELESLGPMCALEPGAKISHEEKWRLFRGVSPCASEADVEANVESLLG